MAEREPSQLVVACLRQRHQRSRGREAQLHEIDRTRVAGPRLVRDCRGDDLDGEQPLQHRPLRRSRARRPAAGGGESHVPPVVELGERRHDLRRAEIVDDLIDAGRDPLAHRRVLPRPRCGRSDVHGRLVAGEPQAPVRDVNALAGLRCRWRHGHLDLVAQADELPAGRADPGDRRAKRAGVVRAPRGEGGAGHRVEGRVRHAQSHLRIPRPLRARVGVPVLRTVRNVVAVAPVCRHDVIADQADRFGPRARSALGPVRGGLTQALVPVERVEGTDEVAGVARLAQHPQREGTSVTPLLCGEVALVDIGGKRAAALRRQRVRDASQGGDPGWVA